MRTTFGLAVWLLILAVACSDETSSQDRRDAGGADQDAGDMGGRQPTMDAGRNTGGHSDGGSHELRDAGRDAANGAATDSGAVTLDGGGSALCRRDPLIITGSFNTDDDGGVDASFIGGVWGGNVAVDAAGWYFTAFGFGPDSDHAVLRVPLDEDEPVPVWHAPDIGILGRGMAVDGDIYVASSAGVLAVHPKTGSHDVLAKLPNPCAPYGGAALDQDNVYVGTLACDAARPGVVAKVPRAGGSAVAIWSSPTVSVRKVAAQDGSIYFSTDAGDLRRIDDGGAGEVTLIAKTSADSSYLPEFALTKTLAYFLTGTEVWSVPLDGSKPSLLASLPMLSTAIAADDSGVYVATSGNANDASAGSIARIAADGSTQPLASGGIHAEEMVLDRTSVYWSALGQAGRIDKCAL